MRIHFFQDLVTVRDSIIHHGAKAEWNGRGKTSIPARYRSPYAEVEISADQIKEAVAKAVEQVKWYGEKLSAVPKK